MPNVLDDRFEYKKLRVHAQDVTARCIQMNEEGWRLDPEEPETTRVKQDVHKHVQDLRDPIYILTFFRARALSREE